MKIEIDKKYKTRADLEYICYWVGNGVVHGAIIGKDGGRLLAVHREDGSYMSPDLAHIYDLIEVKEKKQLTGFVNVYKSNLSTHHRTKELADDYAKAIEIRIACIDLSQYGIFYEEGEGL